MFGHAERVPLRPTSGLARGALQEMETTRDPSAHDCNSTDENHDQLHECVGRSGTSSQPRCAQTKSGAARDEIEEDDRWDGNHNHEERNKSAQKQSHEYHGARLVSRVGSSC